MSPTPQRLTRRAALGLAAVGGLGLSACARGLSGLTSGTTNSLDMMFWGEGDQNKKLIAALALYQRTPDAASINPQYSGLSGYYDKLATRIAGGNPPDVFQIHLPYLTEYINRGAVLPLDPYTDQLGLGRMPSYLSPVIRTGGHYWFALLGAATQPAVVANKTKLDRYQLALPRTDWTLEDFRSTMAQVWQASNQALHGTADLGGSQIALESYLRSLGRSLFTEDGQLGFGATELGDWFELWQRMRADGSAVPMSVTAGSTGFQTDPVTVGKAAYTSTATSRGLPSMQSLTRDTLELLTFPSGSGQQSAAASGKGAGTNIIPAGWFAISARSKRVDQAVSMLTFLTSDAGAAKAMGMARGVPIPTALRTTVAAGTTGLNKAVLDNYALVEKSRPAPLQLYPPGASNLLQTSLPNANEIIGFGQASVAEGVAKFLGEAKKALS